MLEQLSSFIIHLIQSSSYLGIYILMTLEAALIPIPSEVTMSFSGFLAAKGELLILLVVLAGVLGDLSGALISYFIGANIKEETIISLIQKFGKLLLLTPHDYEQSKTWFQKYGEKVVFFSRLLPGLRTFISLPAGVYRMNITKFIAYTLVGSAIWIEFLTYIGFTLGEKWNSLEPYYRKFELGIVVIFVLLILFYLNHKLRIIRFR